MLPPSRSRSRAAVPAYSSPVTAAEVYAGMVTRGIPSMESISFLGTFSQESKMHLDAREKPGTTLGGIGLGQWTGPRRNIVPCPLIRSKQREPSKNGSD